MRTARRFVNDESGMTMALAIIMIVLIGVMGAGLLTFVSKDLNTVAEQNRAQRAFEVADAGIGAAKRQLASNVDTATRMKYDDPDSAGDNIQWAATRGGLTLNNLDGDATTSDSANVTITYNGTAGSPDENFRVISTGTYGSAKRKIEAIFKGVAVGIGGGNILGHPLYYTPSNIKLESTSTKPVTLSALSLFTEGDILINGLSGAPDPSNPQSALLLTWKTADNSYRQENLARMQ